MRTLWYVPVFHTTDETFVGKSLAQTSERMRNALHREDARILVAWQRIARKVDSLVASGDIILSQCNVYCDSLPHPISRYPNLLRKKRFKGQQSPAFDMMQRLRARGARICGTEDPGLLAVYGTFAAMRPYDAVLRGETKVQGDLVAMRDLWIANHLKRSLGERDGILFMGAIHRVDHYLRILAPDIRIRYLRTMLPAGWKR